MLPGSFVGPRGRFLQLAHLGGRESPPLPWFEAAVGDGSDADANQALDGVADGVEHAADLAIAAFVDRDTKQAGTDLDDLGRGRGAVVQGHAGAQPAYVSSVG